jgi:hypothetical protein
VNWDEDGCHRVDHAWFETESDEAGDYMFHGDRRIVAFSPVTYSGSDLQRSLYWAQRVARTLETDSYQVGAFTILARPTRGRDFTTLVNSFAWRCIALFYSVWPEGDPLSDECALWREYAGSVRPRRVEAADGVPFDEVVFQAAADRRRLLLDGLADGRIVAPSPLLLRADATRITPQSLFGFNLDEATVFAAASSAVQAARSGADVSVRPAYRAFDVVALARSYFDPLIFASLFRAIRPAEAYWGDVDAESAIDAILNRFGDEDRHAIPLVLAELLLGLALGKVPRSFAAVLDSRADGVVRDRRYDGASRQLVYAVAELAHYVSATARPPM